MGVTQTITVEVTAKPETKNTFLHRGTKVLFLSIWRERVTLADVRIIGHGTLGLQ
jgi:hypothetical protein